MNIIRKRIIIFIQTNFQKIIADEVVKKYNPEDVLLLDFRNFFFEVENKYFFIRMYGILNILKTLSTFRKNKIRFECDFLIGNLLTNYNSFFLISTIKYSELILMDDGIGTPVILKHPNYYSSSTKYFIKNIIIKTLYRFFLDGKFKTINNFISQISFYYTIYNFKSYIPSEKIKIFKDSIKILLGVKCFLGQPIIEFGQISKEKYINFLKLIIQIEGPIIYYAHPSESVLKNISINGLTFIKNQLPVEKIFEADGIPEYVFSFYSSTLLNIKEQNPNVNIFYVSNNFSISSSFIFESYKMYMQESNIKEYPISLNS